MKSVGFIRPDGLRGLNISSAKEGLKTHYIYDIYKYSTRHVGAARVRVALPRGLACHVASTRGPREIKTNFFNFLFIKNGF